MGAGVGTKCLFARRLGCEAWGVEHNPHYVAAARRFGADVAEGDIAEFADAGRFDIVFMNCPFRLQYEQVSFEAEVAAAMKPGAVLMLGNRAGPAPSGWKQLTSIVERDGAWLKPLEPVPDKLLTGEELRARHKGQAEAVDLAMVLRHLGRDDIDENRAIAYRYATGEAYEAFADGNRRHHGHETIGPVTGPDGAIYGITIMKEPEA